MCIRDRREGIDADEGAALLREFLIQRVQLGKLSHAGIAGGEPEVHHGDGVLGEQVIALDGVAVEVLALEGGELLRLVAIAGCRGAVGREAVTVALGLGSRIGELGLNGGQGALDLPDLLAALAQDLQLVGGKLVLGGFNGVQQEITVVLAVLLREMCIRDRTATMACFSGPRMRMPSMRACPPMEVRNVPCLCSIDDVSSFP